MSKGVKPSERIQEFIDFLETAKSEYEKADKKCEEYDSIERHIQWAHKIEFAENKSERNKIATAMQRERRKRREYKNACDLYKVIYDFVNSDNNKSTLKRLKGCIERQRHQESYLENKREYKRGESSDTD